jgi:H+/Cl- antiporter ClcA
VFRQGKLLVVQIGHSLPPRCVSCNSPAQTLLYKDSTYLPWTGWLFVVLVGLLSKGRVRRFEAFRAQFEVPLCARHETRRKLSIWILSLLTAAFFLTLFVGIYAGEQNPDLDPRLTVGAAGVVALAILLGVIFSYKPFGLKKIDDQFIWLSRVSPEYLRQLREEPTEDPETSVWKWLLITLAFAAVIAGGVWFQWISAKQEAHAAPKAPVATAAAATAPTAPVAQTPPQEAKAPESDRSTSSTYTRRTSWRI